MAKTFFARCGLYRAKAPRFGLYDMTRFATTFAMINNAMLGHKTRQFYRFPTKTNESFKLNLDVVDY